MTHLIVLALGILGVFFVASAALGMLRFPDLFSRMHAITKAGTLGVGLFLIAAAVHFGHDISLVTRALAILGFTLLTAPVSAQMIGRAAYLCRVVRSEEMHLDQLGRDYPDAAALFSARPYEEDAPPVPEEH